MICTLSLLLTCGLLQAQPAGSGALPGLVAKCSDSRHAIQMVVPSPNFRLDPHESVHPALEASFACEFAGGIEVLQAGSYQFDRDGARLWIAGGEIGDQPRRLEAGAHSIRIAYTREPGPTKVRVRWKSERFAWEPLPTVRLMHAASEAPSTEQSLVASGRWLVEEYGCLNCHHASSSEIERRRAPSLTEIGSRIQPAWLHAWLQDPRAHRGDARMPRMLNDEQRRDVATYLATLRDGSSRPAVGNVAQQDANRGAMLIGALGCSACHGDSGVSLDGLGSKFEPEALIKYLIQPEKFEPSGRMPSLFLNEGEATQLATYLLQSRNPAVERSWDRGDAERGKQMLQASGCLACHDLEDEVPLRNELAAPAWDNLRPGRGCLSESSTATPRYAFSEQQREAVEAFLTHYQEYPDVSKAPVFAFRRALDRLRCGACHAIDHARPVAGLREAPPPLTHAGAKLRASWFEGVLTGYNRALDWFDLRMPHYEQEQVRSLIVGFGKASGIDADPGLSAVAPEEARYQRGRDLLGTNPAKGGMACIGCHEWGENKALGEHGPQLIDAAQRLREDWFRRWMMDPARILSGTSMPNYFTSTATEQADEIIATLWAALEKGSDQPAPEGFEQNAEDDPEARPVPTDRPIVVRWDMPEATPAAIAIGLPGGVSYCFDAGESRLRYAWHGGFVDLSGTLLSKRDPETRLSYTAKLVGDVFYRSDSFPIRVGRLDEVPQRRFRGYRLVEGFPEFRYTVDGVDVHEKILKVDGAVGIVREFRFDTVDRPVWLLAEPNADLEITSSAVGAESGAIVVPKGQNVIVRMTIVQER